jgi:hypothetical protein
MLPLANVSTSFWESTPAFTSSCAIGPFGSGRSRNSHVIVGAFWIATQSTCAVVSPFWWAASYSVGTRTISFLSRQARSAAERRSQSRRC